MGKIKDCVASSQIENRSGGGNKKLNFGTFEVT